MTSQVITHLKAIISPNSPTKVSKKQSNQAFLLACKLLSRQHYAKGCVRQVGKHDDDQAALEEFWFQYSFSQVGTVIFVCNSLGQEEIELIKRISHLQVISGHQRLLIMVMCRNDLSIEETNSHNQICQELQILKGSISDRDVGSSQRVLLNISFKKHSHSDV